MNDEIADLIERLKAHRIAGAIPQEEIEWLAEHGRLRQLDTGEILTARAAGYVEGLFIVLSGQIALNVDRANGREKIMEWRGGDVSGVLPYSRLTVPPGDAVAEKPTEIIVIKRDEMPALIRECHGFTSALVHVMVDRARHFTSSDLHADKMASLGKLSAGLAHELNNPVSAIARNSQSLHDAIAASESASRVIGALELSPELLEVIEGVRSNAMRPGVLATRSPIEQSEREEQFEEWLASHPVGHQAATQLAETALTLDDLNQLAGVLERRQLSAVLRWLAATWLTHQLASEIQTAAVRISSLVDAVKGFTQMDQHAASSAVNVAEGLAQTLSIHCGKARAKGVSVHLSIPEDLPRAQGSAGEFNQIWANLIDNALDAVGESGRVDIIATAEGQYVAVRVIDDGPGIPAQIRNRIFDPFFTTKDVGQGTGLGLDIVKRILRKHRGSIAVESQPGRTQFHVMLPVAIAMEARA